MESRASLAEDSILPPEISPKGAVRTTRLSEASAVLVTGATGFLGAFLLDELLRTTGQTPAITVSFATALQAEEGPATECWRP